jgi:phenylpropionate dioxygenase-like ring-hydroxylating dioxygenase large terminal subunit
MAYRFPFPPYPNGWFAIGFSPDFAIGEVVTRHFFGEDLVIYRTRDGAVHATEPHCPHVGAHLGHGGRVVDDCLRCPFHGWRFDGTGQCVEIPGANRIPPRANLRTWSIRENNGVVFAWHHVDGVAPEWELPVLDNDNWTGNRTILWKVRTHPQEVFENVVDVAHLVPLHGVVQAKVNGDPTQDGHKMTYAIDMVADGTIVGMPGMTNDVTLAIDMHGLGHTVVITTVHNAGVRARQRIYCTPLDEEVIEIRGAVNLEKLPDPAVTEQIAELFYRAYVTDFAMDFPVWENKVYRERPLLSSADGPFMVYRRWARQFYSRDTRTPALAIAE